MLEGHFFRSGVKITGSSVIPKATPRREYRLLSRPRQRFDSRKSFDKSAIMLQYCSNSGLLQHDFGYPDTVWILGSSPRKITPVRVIPTQQLHLQTTGCSRLDKFFGIHAERFAFYRNKVSSWIVTLGLQLHRVPGVLIPPEAKRLRVWRLGCILLAFGFLVGCGGRGVATGDSPSHSTSTPTAPAAPSPSAESVGASTPVNVAPGQSLRGIDVIVTPPASKTATNAEDLGVNTVGGQGMASNTGGSIHRGTTMRIVLFGPGLNRDMKVTVAGPADVTISNIQGIEATDNTPGIAFIASVSRTASLGARTVLLRNPNGDVTSFTGGLEVLP